MEIYVEYETVYGYSHYDIPYLLFIKETGSSLKSLFLKSIFFKPNIEFNGFSSLKSLKLENVSISDEQIVSVMSNCSNLEKLTLIKCPRLSNIKISGPSPRLKYLRISYPYGEPCTLEKISINARNLKTLDYCGPGHVSFLYENTPILNVCFTFWVCTGLYSSLVPAILKELVLFVPVSKKNYSLWGLVNLLQASPYLHMLELNLLNLYADKRTVTLMQKPRDLPLHLKELRFGGFSGTSHELKFISYLVKNAKALKKITIIDKRHYNRTPENGSLLSDIYDLKEEAERVSRRVSDEIKEATPSLFPWHWPLLKVIPPDVELICV
ncbi:hypothetical protein AQUCO_02500362v1 [Aquilegia coerulea]|uniref:Uncharacterized protein n=1 Tax=Aquilegia coerulea TaxID=218851 RepID=A0A2G5DAP2_AQUCA|nr:hypothetical protein AQUCO_02500362v1 [Aquilegia coerulea]